jgi:hypothetical protein
MPRLERLIVASGCVLFFAEYVRRYPPDLAPMAWEAVGAPRFDKLLALLAAVATLLVVNLAAWCAGAFLQRLGPRLPLRGSEGALWKLGLGFLALAMAVLGLASVHLLTFPAFAVLLALPVAIEAAHLASGARRLPGAWRSPGRALGAAAVASLLLANGFLSAFSPELGFDAWTYHLALPERYLFENGIAATPFSFASVYPANMGMLYLVTLAVGSEAVAKLLNFEFGVLVLAGLALAGRRLSTRVGWLAPLVLLADPLFIDELTWAYSDLMAAFYAGLAFVAMAAWSETPRRAYLVYCGVFVGAVLGTRYAGAVVLLAVCGGLLVDSRHSWRARTLACVWVGSVAFATVLPWLVRNLAVVGNPVSPMFQSLFYPAGAEYFPPASVAQHVKLSREVVGLGRGLPQFLAGPWNVTMETLPGLLTGSFGFLIGPLHFVAIAGSLLLRDVRRDPRARLLLGVAAVYYAVWFLTFQESRYLLQLFPATAFLGGMVLDRLLAGPEAPRGARFAILGVLVLAVILAQSRSIATLPFHCGIALGSSSREEVLRQNASIRAAELLRGSFGPGDRLLLFYEPWGYMFRGLDYVPFFTVEASPVLQLLHESKDARAVRCALQELGITHVLVNMENVRHGGRTFVDGYRAQDHQAALTRFDGMLGVWGREVWAEDGVRVFRLKSDPALACSDASAR